jgi:hypothetical protein
MLVSDFFTLCKAGATKQFVLDDSSILAFLNLALTEVNKRFDIVMREQIITVDSATNEYKLLPDVMKISAVYTDVAYLETLTTGAIPSSDWSTVISLPINDDNDPNSVYTPNTGTLLIPYPKDNQILSVVYKANSIMYTSDDLEKELDIEPQYISLLVMYIGYLANLALESGQGQSMMLLTMFNQACADIVTHGLHTTNVVINDKLNVRGFV